MSTTSRRRWLSSAVALSTALAGVLTFGISAANAEESVDPTVFYWTDATGDGKWSTPGNWIAVPSSEYSLDGIGEADTVAQRAPGLDPEIDTDDVILDSWVGGDEPTSVEVDTASAINLGYGSIQISGDVTITGEAGLLPYLLNFEPSPEPEAALGSTIVISTPMRFDPALSDLVVFNGYDPLVDLTLTREAFLPESSYLFDWDFAALRIEGGCWYETELSTIRGATHAYLSSESSTRGARLDFFANAHDNVDLDCESSGPGENPEPTDPPDPVDPEEPDLGAPTSVKASRDGRDTLLSWKAPEATPEVLASITRYRVFRYTALNEDGTGDDSTKEAFATVTPHGKVTLWDDIVTDAGGEDAPNTYRVTDLATSGGKELSYDPHETYYYAVRADVDGGNGKLSAVVSPDVPSGGRLELQVTPRTAAQPGQPVMIDAVLANASKNSYGAVSFTLSLPNTTMQKLPVDAQSLPSGRSSDKGWNCSTSVIPQQLTLVNCSNDSVLRAGQVYPRLAIKLNVPVDASRTTFAIGYSATTSVRSNGGSRVLPLASSLSIPLTVGELERAHLAVEVGVPATLSEGTYAELGAATPEGWSRTQIRVTNQGKGATTKPVTVTLPLKLPYEEVGQSRKLVPGGIYFALSDALKRDLKGWTCSVAPNDAKTLQTLSCTTADPLAPGMSAPDLVLPLAASGTRSGAAYAFIAEATSRDLLEAITSRGQASSKLPVAAQPALTPSSVHHDPAGWESTDEPAAMTQTKNVQGPTGPGRVRTASVKESAILKLKATNAGQSAYSGKLAFVETVPMSSLVRSVGLGWACARDGVTVTCEKPSVEIAAGDTFAGPTLIVSPMTTAPIQSAAAFEGTLFTSSIDTLGQVVNSPAVTTDLSTPAGSIAPPVSTLATAELAPFTPGFKTKVTFSMQGHPTMGGSDPQVLVGLVPSQMTVNSTSANVSIRGYAGSAKTPVCRISKGTFPGGYGAAIFCFADQEIPAGSQVDATVDVTVGANVVGALNLPVGTLAPTKSDVGELFDAAFIEVSAKGTSALQTISTLAVESVTLKADAGATQSVEAMTPDDAGVLRPTRVTLDSTGTTALGRALDRTWKQTAGPAVTWLANNDGTAAGTGERPAFAAPLVATNTTVAFEVTVKDTAGVAEAKATTTVTLLPPPSSPPSVGEIRVIRHDNDPADVRQTPMAGYALWFEVPYTDIDSKSVTVTGSVKSPTELARFAPTHVSTEKSGTSGVARMKMIWPSGTHRMEIGFLVSDGSKDASGRAISTPASLVIGPEAPTLYVEASGPKEPVKPGDTIKLTSKLYNPTFKTDTTAVTWSQTSGLSARVESGAGKSGYADTDGVVTVPATAKPGDTLTFQALARRGSGTGAATAVATTTISVGNAPALTAGGTGYFRKGTARELMEGDTAVLYGTVKGGVRPYSVEWINTIGGSPVASVASESDGGFRAELGPLESGPATVEMKVTDANGQVTSQTVSLNAGALPPTPTEVACSNDGPVGMALTAVQSFIAESTDSDKHVTISYRDAVVDFGEVGTLAETWPVSATCGDDWEATLEGASMTYRGMGITDAEGTLSADGLTLESGTVVLPSAWGLSDVTISEVKIDFTNNFRVTGTLRAAELPLLPTLGTGLGTPTVTLTLNERSLVVTGEARVTASQGIVTVSGAYCWGTEECTDIRNLEVVESGEFAANFRVTDFSYFGVSFWGSGTLRVSEDEVDGEITMRADQGSAVSLGALAMRGTATVTWSPDGVEFAATGNIAVGHSATNATITVEGSYADANNWSAQVSGALSGTLHLATGLSVGSGTKISGMVSKSTAAPASAAKPAVATVLELEIDKDWTVGALAVTDMSFILAQGSDTSSRCGMSGLHVAAEGNALIQVGSRELELGIDLCFSGGGAWKASTSLAGSFSPVAGLDLTNVAFAAQGTVDIHGAGNTGSMTLSGKGSAFGVSGAAAIALETTSKSTDLAAGLSVNLADISSSLSGTGRIIYTSKPIADLSKSRLDLGISTANNSARSCADTSSTGSLGFGVPAGFTAIGQFTLSKNMCEVLSEKMSFPAYTNVTAKVSLGPATRSVSLVTSMGGNGVRVFSTSSGTELRLRSAALTLSTDGSIAMTADSTLTMPRPDQKGTAILTSFDATAGITLKVVGTPTLTASLTVASDNWTNALGIQGLTLTQAAIQVGVTFAGIPIPSLGIAATASNLPDSWEHWMGVVGDEPVAFALNLSVDAPILSLTLGKRDGRIFMKPVKAFVPSAQDSLQIDAASLTIAPLGGRIGTIEFPAGFTLSFDAQVAGVGVHFDAAMDLQAGSFRAEAEVGAFTVGPVAMDQTNVKLAISGKEMVFAFKGGFTINANPLSTASSGAARAQAAVDIKTTADGVKLDLSAEARNIQLGTVAKLQNLNLSANANLSSGSAAVSNGFAMAGVGQAEVLGKQFTIGGSIVFSGGALKSFDAIAASDPFNLGPVRVAGRGCSAEAVATLPASLTANGTAPLRLPANGPCLQVGVHPGTATPFVFHISASVVAAGLEVDLQGGVDSTGIRIDNASVQMTDAFVAKVYNSRLYFSPDGNLGDATITSPAGVISRASNGDFRLQGTVAAKFGFVEGDLKVDVGRIGATQSIWAKGALKVGLFQSEASPIHADLVLAGDFSKDGSTYNWSLAGKTDLLLGGTKTQNGWVDAYRLAGAQFTLTKTSFSAAGLLDAGLVSAEARIAMSWGDGLLFAVTGNAQINLLGVNVGAQVRVANMSSSGSRVPLNAGISVSGSIGSFITANVSGTFAATGAMCLSGTGSINLPVATNAPNLASINASICTPGVPGQDAGLRANVSAFNGMINAGVNITSADRFLVYGLAEIRAAGFSWKACIDLWIGEACGGLSAGVSGYLMVAVSTYDTSFNANGRNWRADRGVTVGAGGSLWVEGCLVVCGDTRVDLSIRTNPMEACASVFGYGACYSPPAKFRRA